MPEDIFAAFFEKSNMQWLKLEYNHAVTWLYNNKIRS